MNASRAHVPMGRLTAQGKGFLVLYGRCMRPQSMILNLIPIELESQTPLATM